MDKTILKRPLAPILERANIVSTLQQLREKRDKLEAIKNKDTEIALKIQKVNKVIDDLKHKYIFVVTERCE